jgi:hypothetical protein
MFKKNDSICSSIAQAGSAPISIANSALFITVNTVLTELLLAPLSLSLLGVFP